MSTLLLLTLFQLFYYLMMKGGSETIFLSMSFVSFSAISFLRSNSPLHIGLNLSSVFKVETFMLSFGLIALSLFTLRFFELKIRGRYLVASVCIAIPGIVSILYPNPLHARYISEIAYLIIGVFSIAMLLGAIIVAFQKKRKYVYVIGGLFFALSLAFCFDIFSQTKSFFDIKLPLNPIVLPFTFTLAAIGLALTITHKYWQSFKNATYDHLTGALLRPAFFQRLTEEMRRSQLKDTSLLLAVIHFEELKVIGESYGQITRNKMLAIISEKLSNLLSPADALCHFNDDEFSISTHIDSSVQAEALLKNIHSSLIGTHQIINKDTKLYFNAQISGVIYDSERHLSISQLVQDANYGLAKVKNLHNRDYLLQEYAVN